MPYTHKQACAHAHLEGDRPLRSDALRLLVENAAPTGALVEDRGLDDHLEGEDGGDEAADCSEDGRGLHLGTDELA
eukprot:10472132-Alexandrium_andersonii.AAC.1